jgi:hypothetical protein
MGNKDLRGQKSSRLANLELYELLGRSLLLPFSRMRRVSPEAA